MTAANNTATNDNNNNVADAAATTTTTTTTEAASALSPVASVSSLMAGLTRGALYKIGVTGRVLRQALRKQAFLHIGKQTRLRGETSATTTTTTTTTTPASRVAGLIKSGITGVTVFGTYDYIIHSEAQWIADYMYWNQQKVATHDESLSSSSSSPDETATSINNHRKRIWMQASVQTDSYTTTAKVPLLFHFAAGATAGLMQSLILDVWEVGHYFWTHHFVSSTSQKQQQPKKAVAWPTFFQNINMSLIIRRAFHHALGYATLFGWYESIRRFLVQQTLDYLHSGSPSVPILLDALESCCLIVRRNPTKSVVYDYYDDMTIIPVSVAFCAGGIAGQAHYVVSHWLKQPAWRKHQQQQQQRTSSMIARTAPFVVEQATKNSKPSLMTCVATIAKQKQPQPHRKHRPSSNNNNNSLFNIKPPSLRATMGAFLPTALSFVAFQYGGELTERWINNKCGQTNSPSTSESATNTSSSSSREEPPTFVSYLDRDAKLVSVREATEASSQRAKDEQVREGSPAELFDYSQVLFEEAKAPRGEKTKQQHKFRRPPRSPYKRSSSTPTPPPCSPIVSYHQLSPPRNIVDHTDPTLLSRPNVMRTAPAALPDEFEGGRVVEEEEEEEEVVVTDSSKILMSGGEGLLVGVGDVKGRAYEDGNVEILKTDSKDDLGAPVVTPDKTGPSDA